MSERVTTTLRVLREIQERLDSHERRFEAIEHKLEHGLDSLEKRVVEGHMRLATEIVAVAEAVRGVSDLLRERLDDRHRVDDHEQRIRALERKVG
jgi:hypothetical protein